MILKNISQETVEQTQCGICYTVRPGETVELADFMLGQLWFQNHPGKFEAVASDKPEEKHEEPVIQRFPTVAKVRKAKK